MVVILSQLPKGRLQSDDVPVEVLILYGEDEERAGGELAGRAEARGLLRGRHVLGGRQGALALDEHHAQFGAASCFPVWKDFFDKTFR